MNNVRVKSKNGIPKLVLEGRLPRYISVNRIFLTTTIREFYRLAWRSYRMRAEGPRKSDDDQRSWKALKKRTIEIKTQLQAGTPLDEYAFRLQRQSHNEVLQNVLTEYDYSTGAGINVRTGRTLAAFMPPPVVGDTLMAGPDQVIELKGPVNVDIDVRHDYADEVLYGTKYKRPLFDNGVEVEWMLRASEVGIKAARIEYDRLVNTIGPPKFLNQ